MANDLSQAAPAAIIADIVYSGEKLILPDGMAIPAAVKLLTDRQKYLETEVNVSANFDAHPHDGANAIFEVLSHKYGWAQSVPTPGFWGDKPPELVTIEIGYGKTKQVPWGRFNLPGVAGHVSTSAAWKGNRLVFQLAASVLRKDEATIRDLFNRVRTHLAEHSIYRGKAIKVRFLDDSGDDLKLPELSFLRTGQLREEHLIYSRNIQESIKVNLFTPIERVADCVANDIPIKRGVLLGGVFGTGKTLAATVAATVAEEHGITYIYTPRADELPKAIEFAKQYQSPACVIFCEDIDRVLAGERDVAMDDVLNIIDGIDSKSANIITVLTTNELTKINPAMLRPGRLDAVIEVTPPDAEAVQRLLRLYGGDRVDPTADLSDVGTELQGNIPAVIMETVKRAKLSQLRLQKPGERVAMLSPAALLEAARTMRSQIKLLNDASAPREAPLTVDSQLHVLVERVVGEALQDVQKVLDDIKETVTG